MNIIDSIKNFWNEHIRKHMNSVTALIIVVGCCLVSLLLQYFGRPDTPSPLMAAGMIVIPFQESINALGSALSDTEKKRISLKEAEELIESLKKENKDLSIKLEDQSSLVRENEELRRLLRAKERLSGYEMVECTVIGNDGTNLFERFTIDRGSLDGIKVNMNVINGDGLVGCVSYVGLNYAVVTTLIEDGVNVSAMTKNGHKNCILTGDINLASRNRLRMENALSSIDFSADGTLVTSTVSDRFLPNLLIGYADQTTVNGGGLTQSGEIRCAVDFTRIKEVMVILDLKETPED